MPSFCASTNGKSPGRRSQTRVSGGMTWAPAVTVHPATNAASALASLVRVPAVSVAVCEISKLFNSVEPIEARNLLKPPEGRKLDPPVSTALQERATNHLNVA